MSFSRMKPLPKALILGSIIGAVVYGLTFVKFPEKKAAPAPVEVTAVPSEASAPPPAPVAVPTQPAPVAAAPAPAAGEPPSGLTPASGQDAGLNAVINAGKK